MRGSAEAPVGGSLLRCCGVRRLRLQTCLSVDPPPGFYLECSTLTLAHQQDAAYYESLRADQEKAEAAERQRREAEEEAAAAAAAAETEAQQKAAAAERWGQWDSLCCSKPPDADRNGDVSAFGCVPTWLPPPVARVLGHQFPSPNALQAGSRAAMEGGQPAPRAVRR